MTSLDSLPLTVYARGKRSPVTCMLKCADACSGPECNTSSNPTFRSLASAVLSRRAVLGGGAAAVAAIALQSTSGFGAAAAQATNGYGNDADTGLPFAPIEPVDMSVDAVVVPDGYEWAPLIRWGDPVLPGAPEFDVEHQTAAAQAMQFGYNNDYTDILADASNSTGVLVTNFEYVNPSIMFAPGFDPVEQRAITRAAVGMGVVELTREGFATPWAATVGARSRRITMDSPFALTGPAAGSDLVTTAADPEGRTVLGTLGNCAGGTTPWGTILSGEENFNGFFSVPAPTDAQRRYGLKPGGTSLGWEQDDPRFRASEGFENESNRFGYIVEIDPQDPASTPRKHTAMGRFKHEGANVIVAPDRRVIAYMGDDERGDYLYRFVSKHKFKSGNSPSARRNNLRLLEEGDLFVARFSGTSADIDGSGTLPADGEFDGTGEWVQLTRNGASVVPGFTVAEVLVNTRLAADAVGATKMDRCEDVEAHPTTRKVYVACTNNSVRGRDYPVDEANPRTGNRDGHVIELVELGDSRSTQFAWNILLLCGDPASPDTYFAGFPKELVSPISCPDNVAFDRSGNLWISTDGQPSTLGFNDGLFKVGTEGETRGLVEQFLAVPIDGETCGPIIHDDEGMVFVAVQHPGEDGSWGAQRSLFPDYGPGSLLAPRPSIVQVWRTA